MSFAKVFSKMASRVEERLTGWDDLPQETRERLSLIYKRTRMSIKNKMEEADDEDLKSIIASLDVFRKVSKELKVKTGVSFFGVHKIVRRPVPPHIKDVTLKVSKASSALRKLVAPEVVAKSILNAKAASILLTHFDSVNWESVEKSDEMKSFLEKYL